MLKKVLLFSLLILPAFAGRAAEPTSAASPIAGKLRTRLAADRFLRRLEREGKLTPAQADAVHKLRNHDEMMSDFVAGLPAVKGVGSAMAGDHPILDWLTMVGKAFWDNREEILKFIMSLIALFAILQQWYPALC